MTTPKIGQTIRVTSLGRYGRDITVGKTYEVLYYQDVDFGVIDDVGDHNYGFQPKEKTVGDYISYEIVPTTAERSLTDSVGQQILEGDYLAYAFTERSCVRIKIVKVEAIGANGVAAVRFLDDDTLMLSCVSLSAVRLVGYVPASTNKGEV